MPGRGQSGWVVMRERARASWAAVRLPVGDMVPDESRGGRALDLERRQLTRDPRRFRNGFVLAHSHYLNVLLSEWPSWL